MIDAGTPQRLRGQAMVEFIVILLVLWVLIFGIIQFALLYRAKITLNTAVFDAARVGAVNHGLRVAIGAELVNRLLPLYYVAPASGDRMDQLMQDQQTYNDTISKDLCIERVNPTQKMFQALNESVDVGGKTYLVIPNDNLPYRNQSLSGVSIQDANLLKLRVMYCHTMIVPVISMMLKGAYDVTRAFVDSKKFAFGSSFANACFAKDGFPLVSQAVVRMQSAAWDDSFDTQCH
ncbi:MAG: pilus assembly protein [Gammaproteobacteria bacterium]|jgi:hypothetical protein